MAGEMRATLEYLADTLLPSIDAGNVTMPDGEVRSYTFNLTGTGRVVFGRPPASGPELIDGGEPVVYLYPASPSMTLTAAGPGTLSEYALSIRIGVLAFVTPRDAVNEGDTARGRVLRACDLYEDLQNAVQADRSLGGLVCDVEPTWQVFHGARINARPYGVVEGLLTIPTART